MDGEVHEQPFEIRKDPRVKASDADLRAQFELMVGIRDRISEVIDSVMKIRQVRAQLNRASGEADRVLEQLREIEGKLMIWMGSQAHPMMFGPPGLIEKLSRLSGAVIAADARPTEAMVAVFEDLSERFEVLQNRLNQIIEEEVGRSPLP